MNAPENKNLELRSFSFLVEEANYGGPFGGGRETRLAITIPEMGWDSQTGVPVLVQAGPFKFEAMDVQGLDEVIYMDDFTGRVGMYHPTVVNLTPHKVSFHLDGKMVDFFPSGQVARVEEKTTYVSGVLQLKRSEKGIVDNLPRPVNGRVYIVSRMVLDACPDRTDLLCPADLVRDEAGNIVGCKSFIVS